ncbi:arginine N-succinyl transferase [Haloferula helveola]|uniref:Arginine N-succinyl transferase n=1 Tax=Haloferula helveola TaxID=490095 RepID=A0ABN6H3S7_9BACT|nr:arginine N-succinyl transferase [Haloferula helveola]
MNESDAPVRKKGSCLVKGLVVLALLVVVIGGVWWWNNRPIKPVVLSEEEKVEVVQKVEAIQTPDPEYQKGASEIVLTERELNGLLNERTTLGDKVRFELVTDAIHARVETDLDPDLPVVGGKRLKAKARFLVTQDEAGPHFVIDDVTVWGISLPNDWLGGLKGRDLIAETVGGQGGGLPGVKSMKVESGRIRIELKE